MTPPPPPPNCAQRLQAVETGVAVLQSEFHNDREQLREETEAREKGHDALMSEMRRLYWTLITFMGTIAAAAIGALIALQRGGIG